MAEVLVSDRIGDRAPGSRRTAGARRRSLQRGSNPILPIACRSTTCPMPACWRARLRDVLSWILPAVSFFGVWFFLFRRFAEKQGMGGFLNIGKSRAKVFVEKNTGVTFADVAGMRPRRSWSRSSIS